MSKISIWTRMHDSAISFFFSRLKDKNAGFFLLELKIGCCFFLCFYHIVNSLYLTPNCFHHKSTFYGQVHSPLHDSD